MRYEDKITVLGILNKVNENNPGIKLNEAMHLIYGELNNIDTKEIKVTIGEEEKVSTDKVNKEISVEKKICNFLNNVSKEEKVDKIIENSSIRSKDAMISKELNTYQVALALDFEDTYLTSIANDTVSKGYMIETINAVYLKAFIGIKDITKEIGCSMEDINNYISSMRTTVTERAKMRKESDVKIRALKSIFKFLIVGRDNFNSINESLSKIEKTEMDNGVRKVFRIYNNKFNGNNKFDSEFKRKVETVLKMKLVRREFELSSVCLDYIIEKYNFKNTIMVKDAVRKMQTEKFENFSYKVLPVSDGCNDPEIRMAETAKRLITLQELKITRSKLEEELKSMNSNLPNIEWLKDNIDEIERFLSKEDQDKLQEDLIKYYLLAGSEDPNFDLDYYKKKIEENKKKSQNK